MNPPRPPHAPAPPTRRFAGPARVARLLLWALPALGVALVLGVAGLAWLTRTDDGAAWLLARVPGIVVTAPRGSLARTFEADRVVIALPGAGGDRVVLSELRWEGLRLRRATHAPHWLGVTVQRLRIARVDVLRAPSTDQTPARPPATLALPVEVDLPELRIGALYASALGEQPVRDLRAAVHLGAQDAEGRDVHRVDDLALAFDHIGVRGEARIASQAPFDLAAELRVAPAGAPAAIGPLADFDAAVRARGPLDWINLTAQLRGRLAAGRADAAAPQLDVKAALLPFAAWPLGALEATTRALDLSALSSVLPSTALTGTATLASDAAAQPATLSIALDNERPGRVDEGMLPVRRLQVDARARPDAPRHIELHGIDALLGSAARPAGRLHGDGRWHDGAASFELQLDDVRPRLLDARAPAMRLSGRTTLGAEGLAGGAAARFALAGRIDGALVVAGRERRVLLQLDAAGDPRHVELREAKAEAGKARATLAGSAVHEANGDWRVRGRGSVAAFDPSQWWPGREGTAWRAGPHRLNGRASTDLRWPAGATSWTALRGTARLDLADSVLAGVPLAGRVEVTGAAAPIIDAALDVAGANVAARGRLGPRTDDHWEVDARGADLARFAPLLRLVAADLPPLAGRLDLQASADGRWPALATQGRAVLAQGRLGEARVGRAEARWRLGSALDAPLDVDARVADLAFTGNARERLETAHLQLQGTLAEQRISLDASAPAQPPAWLDMLREAAARRTANGRGSMLVLAARGGLDAPPLARGPLHWRGQLQQLALRPTGSADVAPWLATRDVALDLRAGAGAPPAVEAQPGRLELPGAVLRWSRLRWQGGAQPALDLQARLEPVAVAPLLARLQPDFGWRGNLVVGARIEVRSAPRLQAAVELLRESGDLSVSDATGTLPLGLTDLRLALDVQDGVWSFTQAFAGKTLGAMAAAATVRTQPERLWPAADAPLSGVLEASVANLAAWSVWVPPGWRLGGMLHASASIGGRFGAPQYRGEIDGRDLAARNLIEGIDVHDGELAVSLDGETARIERFVARAGDGRVAVDGGANFGAKPAARLQLVAERLLVLGRVDRRIVASGRADLGLAADALRLDGRFTIDEGLIDISRAGAPALGSDVHVVRPGRAEPAAKPPAAARQLALDVTLDLGQQLRLRGRGIDTLLRGELHVGAPSGQLAVDGSVRTAEGHYAAYGQKLDIERGLLAFAGAPDNPRLDIVAIRPNLDVRVGVAIAGSAQAPRVRLISEPEMSDVDKLSWLVLGRASEGLGSADTALLQRAALGLLAGERNGPDLTQRLGLDDLSLRQQANGEVHETIVSLGKQLTRRWYVGYERGLSATAGTWQLIYRVAQRFTLRAQSGADNSLDLIWTWRWQ